MKTISMYDCLRGNEYPGRGLAIGQSADGKHAVSAYFIMGRSVNSRNRVFVMEGDDMRTQAFDPAKLSDPSLVIYFPVRMFDGGMIVTNGDQTDTIYDKIKAHPDCVASGYFIRALLTRTFEPDPPILTPRISGILDLKDGGNYWLSILKSLGGDETLAQRQFFSYDAQPGVGHFIHTYAGNGDPVPSFAGEPAAVEIPNDIDSFTQGLWESLNEENKVSLFVRFIDLESGAMETRLVNKNQ